MPKLIDGEARRRISTDNLTITFEGAGIEDAGLPLESFLSALGGLQDAMRLLVVHLGGGEMGKPGSPPKWAREQSALRLVAIHKGSMITELIPRVAEAGPDGEHFGIQAMRALRRQNANGQPALPEQVLNKLGEMSSCLPDGTKVWLGDMAQPRQTEVRPPPRPAKPPLESEHMLLWGWLKEINWAKNTAQLHEFHGADYIRLRFDKKLKDQMTKLATKHVEVRGHGQFKRDNKLDYLQVEEIEDTRSMTLTMEEYKNNPNPKIYYPNQTSKVDMDYKEYQEFRKEIRNDRNLSKSREIDV